MPPPPFLSPSSPLTALSISSLMLLPNVPCYIFPFSL